MVLFYCTLGYLAASTSLLNREYCGCLKLFPPVVIAWIPTYLSYQWPVAGDSVSVAAAAASPAGEVQHWAMETPSVTISADSSGLSTQTPSMNAQPSSLSLTIGESPPHPPKTRFFPLAIKMPEVFSLSHPIPCSSCVFLRAEQETKRRLACESNNGCRWCCVVHPCGWRLAVCALSCVRCNASRDEIKWHGVDSSGLKF